MRREAWIINVAETVRAIGGKPGRVAGEWLIDADLTMDPIIGERIAAEAAASSLAAMPPRQCIWEAGRLSQALYGSIRPPQRPCKTSFVRSRWFYIQGEMVFENTSGYRYHH